MVDKVKKKGGRSRVSRKMQITIPKAAAVAAGFEPGDHVSVESVGHGRLLLSHVVDPVDDLVGTFSYPPDYLEELREEWQ